MTLTIYPCSTGVGEYFSSSLEYYQGDCTSSWHWGNSCEDMGVFPGSGHAASFEVFNSIAAGVHPLTGQPRGQRKKFVTAHGGCGRIRKSTLTDFTFSAPKSFSLWLVGSNAQEFAVGFDAACKATQTTLDYIESDCLEARVGAGGLDGRVTGKALFTLWAHSQSRATDPQFHFHCLTDRVIECEDRKQLRTAKAEYLYAHSMSLGALWRLSLATELQKRGFKLEAKKVGAIVSWEIAGFPQALSEKFSTRSKQIAEAAKETGARSAKALKALVLLTRDKKESISQEALKAKTLKGCAEFGITPAHLKAMRSTKQVSLEALKKQGGAALDASVDKALDRCVRNVSSFDKPALLRAVCEEAMVSGAEPKAVLAKVDSTLADHERVVALGEHRGKPIYSTKEVVEAEIQVIDACSKANLDSKHALLENQIPKDCAPESKRAVAGICKHSSKLTCLDTSKPAAATVALGAVASAYERAGYDVKVLAPNNKSTKAAETALGRKATTVGRALAAQNRGARERVGHVAKQLGRAVIKKQAYTLQPKTFAGDEKTLVIVTDAQRIPNAQLAKLTKHALQADGCKMLLAGDASIPNSVSPGGGFAAIAKRVGTIHTQIDQQQPAWRQLFEKHLEEKQPEKAFAQFQNRGLLSVFKTRSQAIDAAAKCVVAAQPIRWPLLKAGKCSVALGLCSNSTAELNKSAQKHARSKGRLGLLGVKADGGVRIFKGDRVQLRQGWILKKKGQDLKAVDLAAKAVGKNKDKVAHAGEFGQVTGVVSKRIYGLRPLPIRQRFLEVTLDVDTTRGVMQKRTTRKILVPANHVPNAIGLGYAVRVHEVGNLPSKPARSVLVIDRDNTSRDDLIAASRGTDQLHMQMIEGITKKHAAMHKASLKQDRQKRFATDIGTPVQNNPKPEAERDQGMQR